MREIKIDQTLSEDDNIDTEWANFKTKPLINVHSRFLLLALKKKHPTLLHYR